MQGELQADIQAVQGNVRVIHAELQTDIQKLGTDLYRHLWIMGMGVIAVNIASVSLAVALIKFVP